MKCPVCGKNFRGSSSEGCSCGYSSNMLERIGSTLEYNGQRMTTQASLILVVAIGLFSITSLTNSELPVTEFLGVSFYASQIIFVILYVLGGYVLYRFQDTRSYCTELESILRFPEKFLQSWKEQRNQDKKNNEESTTFGKYLVDYKEVIREISKNGIRRKNVIIKSFYFILATKLTYVAYTLFVIIVLLSTYYI